jgi:hypothetical protein
MVVSTSLGVLTNSDGRYTLRGVPTGGIQIRALRVGYQELKQPITVTAGAAATLDFVMVPAIVQLQGIVTTATGEQRKGRARKRARDDQRVEESRGVSAISTFSDLLVAKASGVQISRPA